MYFSNRDYYCPVCGGWLESEDGEIFSCDTCDYTNYKEISEENTEK